jgi:hypothetical protein
VSVFRLRYTPIWDLDIWEVKFSKITRISKEYGICHFDTRHVFILESRIPE